MRPQLPPSPPLVPSANVEGLCFVIAAVAIAFANGVIVYVMAR